MSTSRISYLVTLTKLSRFISVNAKSIVRLVLIIGSIIIFYNASVILYKSPEYYMLNNWNTMQEFATTHREYTTSADKVVLEETLKGFFGQDLNK